MPVNYPRINELPEWFTAASGESYELVLTPGERRVLTGREMAQGVTLELEPLQPMRLAVRRKEAGRAPLAAPSPAKPATPAPPISFRSTGGPGGFTPDRHGADSLPADKPTTDSAGAANAWQEKHRAVVVREVMRGPRAKRHQTRAETIARDETSTSVTERVELMPPDGTVVHGLFLRPKTPRPSPVVVWTDASLKVDGPQSPAVSNLLGRGIAVFQVELRPLKRTPPVKLQGDWLTEPAKAPADRHVAARRAYDVLRAVDYLAERSDVRPGRIACIGVGHQGGLTAMLAAALDGRVCALGLSGSLVWLKSYFRNDCAPPFDMAIPSVLRHTDVPHLLALVAPRPARLVNVTNANGQPLPASRVSGLYAAPKAVYAALGAPNGCRVMSTREASAGPLRLADWVGEMWRRDE